MESIRISVKTSLPYHSTPHIPWLNDLQTNGGVIRVTFRVTLQKWANQDIAGFVKDSLLKLLGASNEWRALDEWGRNVVTF